MSRLQLQEHDVVQAGFEPKECHDPDAHALFLFVPCRQGNAKNVFPGYPVPHVPWDAKRG